MRLLWYPRGRGDRDVALVETVALEAPQTADRRQFSLELLAGPPTFRGELIELVWTIEVVAVRAKRQGGEKSSSAQAAGSLR